MRSNAASVLVAAILVVGAFGAALGAGYVYSHEPAPERIEVRLDTSNPPPSEQVLPATIDGIDDGTVEVTTVLGTSSVDLDGVIIEELEPLDGTLPVSGVPANLGGTRTDSGYVLSGVVIVEAAP
ncbi:MAG: hypothetical protein R3C39_12330 [Dehalococcoidia bacterium]